MGKDKVTVLGVQVDRVTLEQAADRCLEFIRSGRPHLVVTPNAEFVAMAAEDPEFRDILNSADLAVPDGAGVVLAARLLGDPLPGKVAGVDLAAAVLRRSPPGTRVFLLGATADAVAAAAARLVELYPQIAIAGYHDGYWRHFDPEEDRRVIERVRAAAPHILFCGMGAPKQEKWLHRYLHDLQVPLCMGIGGGIDMWAGKTPRAPGWMVRANLEWLYRIVRFGRYGRSVPRIARFLWRVLQARARGRAHHPDRR